MPVPAIKTNACEVGKQNKPMETTTQLIPGIQELTREKQVLQIIALIWSKCLLPLNYFYILVVTFLKLLG